MLVPFDGQWLACKFEECEHQRGTTWVVRGHLLNNSDGPPQICVSVSRPSAEHPTLAPAITKVLYKLFLRGPSDGPNIAGHDGDYLVHTADRELAEELVTQPVDQIYKELERLLLEGLQFVRDVRSSGESSYLFE